METVSTEKAPVPAGHYSQAVAEGNFVFVSGQLPIEPRFGIKRDATIEEQTALALTNLKHVLEAAGSDMDHVVKVTICVSDIRLWDRVNKVYSEMMGVHRPARSVIPTGELHYGCLVEIDAIAVKA